MQNRRLRITLTLLFAPLLGLSSCSGPVPGPGAPFREQTLLITGGDVPARIAAAPVGRVATTLDHVVLDRPYTLEFLPLAEGDAVPDGLQLNTYVVTGSGGSLVASNALVPMGPLRDNLDGALNTLASPVRVDLSSYAGQTVALRWAIEPASPEQSAPRAYVAGYRLRLSDPPERELPDILMICSDTHRYDFALGAEGRELMPNLQELATQSITYDWTFSAASWTLPSITSIFTGLPPRYHQTGRRTGQLGGDAEPTLSGTEFGVDWGEPPYQKIVLTRFPRELTTLGEKLQNIGYTTAMVATNPMYYLSSLLVDGIAIPVGAFPIRGDVVNDAVRDILRVVPDDRPVFLVVHYMDVHQWIQWHYDRDYPGTDAEEASRQVVLASYSEPVEESDGFLGELLNLWRDSRDYDDSLIMFFADHGEHLLDPTLGHGNTMQDVLLHVPLVVKYPRSAGVTAGQRVSTPVSLTDLAPTVLDLVGDPVTLPPFAGRALPRANAEPPAEPRSFFADFQLYGDELSSVRRGDFKLVVDLDKQTSQTTEWRTGSDSAGEIDRQTAMLAKAMAEYDGEAARITENLETAPTDARDAMEALKSLGYVQ